MARHLTSCVSARWERSSQTSYIAFVGAVPARRRDRSRERRLSRFPCRIVLYARGVRVSHIPREAVEPNLVRDLRLARVLQIFGPPLLRREHLLVLLVFRLGWRALELSDLFALRVHEGERDVSLGLVPQPVRDKHAVRRVLSRVDVDLRLLACGLLDLPVRHDRRAGHAVVLAGLGRLWEPHTRAEAHGRARRE